jgi:hypothetical protein
LTQKQKLSENTYIDKINLLAKKIESLANALNAG